MKEVKSACSKDLPSNYQFINKIDLKNDKKIMLKIQIYFFIIIFLMFVISNLFDFPMRNNIGIIKNIMITILTMAVYMFIHELIHGCFFYCFSGIKPIYLFRFPFICTGSEAYYNKKYYVIIALAPLFILGALLISMLYFLPDIFFPTLYLIATFNFAGAAGDIFQTISISKLPSAVLIQDNGEETKIFLPQNE